MKKFLVILQAFVLIIGLNACSQAKADNTSTIEKQNSKIEVAMVSGGEVLAWPLAYDIKEILGE